jgi:hypothetical protein
MKILFLFLALASSVFAARSFNGSSWVAQTAAIGVPFTFAAWIYPTDTTNGQTVFYNGDTGGTVGYYMNYRANLTNKPVGVIHLPASGGSAEARQDPGITTSRWAHVAAVFTSTNSRSAYVDGASTTNTDSKTSVTPTKIEYGRFGSAAGYFTGAMAEAGIWNVALSADEITALSKGFSPLLVRPSALIHFLPMWRDLADFKGPTATNNGSTATGDHPRVYR